MPPRQNYQCVSSLAVEKGGSDISFPVKKWPDRLRNSHIRPGNAVAESRVAESRFFLARP